MPKSASQTKPKGKKDTRRNSIDEQQKFKIMHCLILFIANRKVSGANITIMQKMILNLLPLLIGPWKIVDCIEVGFSGDSHKENYIVRAYVKSQKFLENKSLLDYPIRPQFASNRERGARLDDEEQKRRNRVSAMVSKHRKYMQHCLLWTLLYVYAKTPASNQFFASLLHLFVNVVEREDIKKLIGKFEDSFRFNLDDNFFIGEYGKVVEVGDLGISRKVLGDITIRFFTADVEPRKRKLANGKKPQSALARNHEPKLSKVSAASVIVLLLQLMLVLLRLQLQTQYNLMGAVIV